MLFNEIYKAFNIQNIIGDPEILEGGNINTTYIVYDIYNKGYVIQKINKNVFKNPIDVMNNIELITNHILNKNGFTLKFYKTTSGLNYYLHNGEYYRIAKYIKNSKTVTDCKDLSIIENVGRAYGSFQNSLDGLDSLKLKETIKDFHNTPKRFSSLEDTISKNPDRYESIKEELDELLSFKKEVSLIKEALDNKEIPYRTTHNDTKADNVLFDKTTGKVLCVIDLDTVMPGSLLYDYGDSIRSIASNTREDSIDLENVFIDLEKFKAYSIGFLEETKNVLTKKEIELLSNSVLTMTAELAVRFYDDYLNNDTYFRIAYPLHNLTRARCMLTLTKNIKLNLDKMNSIVNTILSNIK